MRKILNFMVLAVLLPALLMSRRLPVFPVLRVLPIPLHFPGLWGPPVVWMILSSVRIRVP